LKLGGLISAWLAALLLAVLAATLLFALLSLVGVADLCLLAPAFVAILGYAILAGLPTATILYLRRWTHPLVAPAVGLVLGALPAAMFSWWYFALLGGVSAAVFWATLRSCGVLAASGASVRPRLGIALAGIAILLTVLAMQGMSAIPTCGDSLGR
jgi:hypothetical protein